MSSVPYRPDAEPWVAPGAIQWYADDMTVTLGGDVPWTAQDTDNGLWLAIDCQGRPHATVAELVQQNSTGPLRLGYGAWRDQLLGCQFRNGRGELISAGGRTMKNVAGYDLTKFIIGQSGVLGKIVAVTMRAYRKPQDALLAEWEPRMELFNELIASPCRPQWAVLTQSALHCGYLGNRQAVDYYADKLNSFQPRRKERHGFRADVAWRTDNWRTRGESGWTMRASVPPMHIAAFAQRAGLKNWVADPAFGIVLASAAPNSAHSQSAFPPRPVIRARGPEQNPDAAAISAAAAAVGGRAWFWNDAGVLAAFDGTPGERAILNRLKTAMDPDNQLSPTPSIP